MDIFITNVQSSANHQQLRLFLKEPLSVSCDTLAFDLFKKVKTEWAILTIPDESHGRIFLSRYGSINRSRQTPLQTLSFQGLQLKFQRSNRSGQPDPRKVQALRNDEQRLRQKLPKQLVASRPSSIVPFASLSLGVLGYHPLLGLSFDLKYTDAREGTLTFGKFSCALYLKAGIRAGEDWHCRIDIPYSAIEHTIRFTENEPSVMFTLQTPPKFYEIVDTNDLHLYSDQTDSAALEMRTMLSVMTSLQSLTLRRDTKRLSRLCTLHRDSPLVPSMCMVYKVVLPHRDAGQRMWEFVRSASTMPERDCFTTTIQTRLADTIEQDFYKLKSYLAQRGDGPTSHLLFDARFQLLALVYEGTITPGQMLELLPRFNAIARTHKSGPTAAGIRRLGYVLPTPSPRVHKDDLSTATIEALLLENVDIAEQIKRTSKDLVSKQTNHTHLAHTYKATITPTGMLLRGPDPIVSNRVLRKYIEHSDYFIRVFFADEDGLSVFQDPRADQGEVYRRFRKVLQEGIPIADRVYSFWGGHTRPFTTTRHGLWRHLCTMAD